MVTPVSQNTWLREISRWRLEAAEEDSARYFYPVRGVDAVQSGISSYVIGRKGSGKTAVAEHISSLRDSNVFVRSLSFKNFPFNELYKLSDSGFRSPSQYTTIWKYIIYSAVCSLMAESAAIDPEVSKELSKYYTIDFERGLATTITRITDVSGGLRILGTGGDFDRKSTIVENPTSWPDRVHILEDIIVQHIDRSTYFILFDELDEDYRDVLEVDASKHYFDLLIGLFKAVYDVKRKLGRKVKVFPVVFLREDIYDLLRDNDKNKWRDSALTLSWSEGQLRDLVAFRLARARDDEATTYDFSDEILQLFSSDFTRAGGIREKKHIFKYILARTLLRPRDIISYLRECARVALEDGVDRISTDTLNDVNKRYSRRLREEFVDEIQGAIPYINDIFEILSGMRKQIFSYIEFRVYYESYVEAHPEVDAVPFVTIAKILFHYSAIGVQPTQRSSRIFKYAHPEARINFNERAIIHLGLLNSLQIA